jgi:endonuclease/exonuclease/phosphatase family metal-dependent hydrolase
MVRAVPPILAALLLAPASPARGDSEPILPDGDVSEWTGAPFATDPAGDGDGSGVDFRTLYVANDTERLFLRFDTTAEVQPDEQQNITVALDTDANPATGQPVGSIGAELVWNLGQRSGTFRWGGSSYSVGHADLGLIVGPTVSATEFEIAFDRAAVPAAGHPLFPGSQVRVALFDGASGGDLLDAGGATYTFDETPRPVPSIPLTREDASHVRIASYNVLNDGLFGGGAQSAAFGRIFAAVDPDLWVLCEIWNHSASETRDRVEALLPSGPGETWNAVKLDPGNVVVTRFPVLDSWLILPGSRLTAVLVDPRPKLDTDLLVIGNHWACCTADAQRQEEADALIAFLRDARTAGGTIDLAPDTPIVAAGDFNLVGWRDALDTMIFGDISDNGTYGPDSPPDWDGGPFRTARPRHPDERLGDTWRNDASSYYPGKLDWMFYTGSVFELQRHFVLDSRSMTSASLAAAGLQADDTVTASDHAPIVADFAAPGSVPVAVSGVPSSEAGLALASAVPNPFQGAATIAWTLPRAGHVRLTVHDVTGRLVAVLEDGPFAAGMHATRWDGRGGHGAALAGGVYFLRLDASGVGVRGRRVVLAR